MQNRFGILAKIMLVFTVGALVIAGVSIYLTQAALLKSPPPTLLSEELWGSTLLILLITTVVLLLGYLLIYRSIAVPLFKASNNLLGISGQTQSSAGRVSNLSLELSESAANQAASLEEISSTMLEIDQQARDNRSSARTAAQAVGVMGNSVRQTDDNARLTVGLSQEARSSAKTGVEAVNTIVEAMQHIRQGSEQITAIIEVIDGITHQTKMLATNAAIEAARAGEHGKGFAVVADEVSKLAEHSKQAAREISSLIRESAERSQEGETLASQGAQVLQDILDHSVKVSDLIAEISSASQEQRGKMDEVEQLITTIQESSDQQSGAVEQVSAALQQLDRLTQSNASNAEDTADSSGQLSGQARTLRDQILALSNLLGVQYAQPSGATIPVQQVERKLAVPPPPAPQSGIAPDLSAPPVPTITPTIFEADPSDPLPMPPLTPSEPSPPEEAESLLPMPPPPPAGKGATLRIKASDAIPMRDDFSEF